jgi:DNA-binding NarL/FixJ family response regulator
MLLREKAMRLLLADRRKMMRDGLRTLFQQEGIEVVGEAEEGWQTVALALKLLPHLVVMEVGLQGLNGVEATRRLLQDQPGLKIIVLGERGDAKSLIQSLKAGAAGCLPKEDAFAELIAAVRRVMDGHIYLSPALAGFVVQDYVRRDTDTVPDAFTLLTPRERQVLQLLAEGHSTKQIASRLHVSAKTIDTHRQEIMRRLRLHSVAELTKYAIRERLTSLHD